MLQLRQSLTKLFHSHKDTVPQQRQHFTNFHQQAAGGIPFPLSVFMATDKVIFEIKLQTLWWLDYFIHIFNPNQVFLILVEQKRFEVSGSIQLR